jgi:hypothetical protein
VLLVVLLGLGARGFLPRRRDRAACAPARIVRHG